MKCFCTSASIMFLRNSVKVVKASLSHPRDMVHRPLLFVVLLPLLNFHKRDHPILFRIEGLAYKIRCVVALPREGSVPMTGDNLRVRQTRVVWVGEVRGVQVEIWRHAEGLKLVALDFQAG